MSKIIVLDELAKQADYSFISSLNPDPISKDDGIDHHPREVFSGHYVPVRPTPILEPIYITHSKTFFEELGLDDKLATSEEFIKMFSADTSSLPKPLKQNGWACGYALSIYGTEYYEQCPFQTGNGYGDGRAISIFEGVLNGKRWEMQLKGGGKTPYCRGADGRAVLRSSIREFLAAEHMYGLGVPTSRSLCLYTSNSQSVQRPWFRDGSYSKNPEVMILEKIAISTRVAPSFIRVGQLELFGRRARKKEHPNALKELELLVLHLIDREYSDSIDKDLPFQEKVLLLAKEFQERLTTLVSEWIRVGYCQGNFNSDNCALGGFTLDYGPFGFIDMFDPKYQPWTGGGVHFSFLNQAVAAEINFDMFCVALSPLFQHDKDTLIRLEKIRDHFAFLMNEKLENMWAKKLGMESFNTELFKQLISLMVETHVDYTIFFRELSNIPKEISFLEKSFYDDSFRDDELFSRWTLWLQKWRDSLHISTKEEEEKLSKNMKTVNPKYTLREWILVPAYQKANQGDYTLVKELQEIMIDPYAEHSKEIEKKYYKKKSEELFNIAGISHISCSS